MARSKAASWNISSLAFHLTAGLRVYCWLLPQFASIPRTPAFSGYFSPDIEVERIGVNSEWQREF